MAFSQRKRNGSQEKTLGTSLEFYQLTVIERRTGIIISYEELRNVERGSFHHKKSLRKAATYCLVAY